MRCAGLLAALVLADAFRNRAVPPDAVLVFQVGLLLLLFADRPEIAGGVELGWFGFLRWIVDLDAGVGTFDRCHCRLRSKAPFRRVSAQLAARSPSEEALGVHHSPAGASIR